MKKKLSDLCVVSYTEQHLNDNILFQEKYAEALKRDALRKKAEREAFKENVEKHPRKYKATVEKRKAQNEVRVQRFREKQRAIKEAEREQSTPKPQHPQARRRIKEKKKQDIGEKRKKEHRERVANRNRVQAFRMRIKLQTPTSAKQDIQSKHVTESPDNYKHKSSETRAYKRVSDNLPQTPAKKVRIIEKIVQNTTPRSRKVLESSPSLQAVFVSPTTCRSLDEDYKVIESVKESVEELKTRKKSKQMADIIANKLLKKSRKVSAASRLFGVPRKALSKRINSDGELKRKERSDKLSQDHSADIHNFYLEKASRAMPNKRDVLLLKDQNGTKVPVQKHIMEMSQEEAFKKFKEENPAVKVSKRKFDSLKPAHVRRISTANRIVCCCTYCENIRLKVQTLNKLPNQNHRSTADILDETLCPKSDNFHQFKCINRECDSCGTQKLRELYNGALETQGENIVTWTEWKKQSMPLNAEKNVVRVVPVQFQDTFTNFFDNLCVALEPHAGYSVQAGNMNSSESMLTTSKMMR